MKTTDELAHEISRSDNIEEHGDAHGVDDACGQQQGKGQGPQGTELRFQSAFHGRPP